MRTWRIGASRSPCGPPHVGAYGDAALHDLERTHLIEGRPRYVGHARMVPEPGD